jgi:hypothetical protein
MRFISRDNSKKCLNLAQRPGKEERIKEGRGRGRIKIEVKKRE